MLGKQNETFICQIARDTTVYLICTARISCWGTPCMAPTSAKMMRIFRFAGISGQMPLKFLVLTFVSELNGSRPMEENGVI